MPLTGHSVVGFGVGFGFGRRRSLSPDHLPLVCYKSDLAVASNRSERTIERLRRAKKIPEPLDIPGRPCWSRDAILAWLSGGGRGKRPGQSLRDRDLEPVRAFQRALKLPAEHVRQPALIPLQPERTDQRVELHGIIEERSQRRGLGELAHIFVADDPCLPVRVGALHAIIVSEQHQRQESHGVADTEGRRCAVGDVLVEV